MNRKKWLFAGAGLLLCLPFCAQDMDGKDVQTLRLVQDDAQDYMVSKIYHLKYVQANDVSPFLLGIVRRYNMNSSVSPSMWSFTSSI